jgi:hypothetical protein
MMLLRYFKWVLLGVGQAGKRDTNESGTQELLAWPLLRIRCIRKGWHFLQAFPKNRISWADCRMNRPFSNWLERSSHPFNPRPGFTGLMPE